MATLTQLGRFLRKLRIDRGELLRDMAATGGQRLLVSMGFLRNRNMSLMSQSRRARRELESSSTACRRKAANSARLLPAR